MIKTNLNLRRVAQGAVVAALGVASQVHAAAVDVSAVVTDIGAQATPVAAIGGAVLVLIVGIKAFRWVRQAMA